MKYVIAGNYQEFLFWRKENFVEHKDSTYISGPERLYGMGSGTNVILLGTYYEREDWYNLTEMIQQRRLTVTKEFL